MPAGYAGKRSDSPMERAIRPRFLLAHLSFEGAATGGRQVHHHRARPGGARQVFRRNQPLDAELSEKRLKKPASGGVGRHLAIQVIDAFQADGAFERQSERRR
jgi:hypothetical protein